MNYYSETLNIVSDNIIIFSLSPRINNCIFENNDNNNTNHINKNNKNNNKINNNKIQFERIIFMNNALLDKLKYKREEKEEEIEEITKQYSGSLNYVIHENNKLYCKIYLQQNSDDKSKVKDGVGMFLLNTITYIGELNLLRKFYNDSRMYMSILEVGPDDDTYQWSHILPNEFVYKNYYNCAPDQVDYTSSKKWNQRQRREFYNGCKKAKADGSHAICIGELENPISETILTYLYTNPFTTWDVYAFAVWDMRTAVQHKERLVELSEFFEKSPTVMGALALDKDELKVLYINNAAANFFEVDKSVCGKSVTGLRDCDTSEVLSFYENACKESRKIINTPVHFEKYVPGPGGELRYAHFSVTTPYYDKTENYSRHLYILNDLSPLKNAEQALEKHKNNLEEIVRVRTQELKENEEKFRSLVLNAPNIILMINKNGTIQNFTERDAPQLLEGQLLQSLVEGSEIDEHIKFLFDNHKQVTTDIKLADSQTRLNLIRTPLSGIIGMARILQETELTLDQSECVATIQNCGESLLSVINDVLDYTKLEATGMIIENTEMSLSQCVEEYTVLPTAQKKKLELIVNIDSSIPDRILGDMLKLRQVIVNILSNAVKFTDVGYVLVSLTATPITESNEWKFNFTVKDTGCGVPRDSQGKLFQMFSQVDVSTTRRYGGTGIGLALARKLLELMKGEISVESEGIPGSGSTFSFFITAIPVPFTPCTLICPLPLIENTNIFIIDESPIAGEILQKRLKDKGFLSVHVVSSDTLEDTFNLIELSYADENEKTKKNTVVFCDINKINTNSKYPLLDYPNVMLVLMGYVRDKTIDVNFTPKFEFLRKPIKREALVRCLKAAWYRFGGDAISNAREYEPPICLRKLEVAMCSLHVLVAEDNEVNQKIVNKVFQHLGYPNVHMANNGKEALEYIQKNGLPDLILMDVQMPILDGIETTKLIRRKYSNDWPYIVSMTADAFEEDRKKCLEAGMTEFLTKPIRVEQVQATLQKCAKLKCNRE